jgi:hypothetical protein
MRRSSARKDVHVNAIKIGAIVGGAFVAGDIGGGRLADMLGIAPSSEWSRKGVKLGTGIAAYLILASVLG